MIVIFLISIVFIFVIQYEMGFQIYIKLRKDPPGIICDQVTKSFGDNLPYMATLEYYYLEVEWEGNRFSNLNDKISRTGALPCFCQNKKEEGNKKNQEYLITSVGENEKYVKLC